MQSDVMTDHWFTPKSHGYGASPANWKGWLATGIFGVLTIGLAVAPSLMPDVLAAPDWPWRIALWLTVEVCLVIGFVALARAKTDGEWRWRWGTTSRK